MARYSVGIGLFPDNRGTTFISPDIWVGRLLAKLETDAECWNVHLWYREFGDTPITMLRNRFLVDMEERKMDFALMIDSDNKPDLYLGMDSDARPFWDTAIQFMRDMDYRTKEAEKGGYKPFYGPCVVAAPYCGSPPDEGVHAFRWVNFESSSANPNFSLKTISRHEAAYLRGIRPCAAAATGVMLIDMRGVAKLDHPRFDYEWSDRRMISKASTEDVFFTRNLSYQGVPTFINWDAWAGHAKIKMVGKPIPIHTGSITNQLRKAVKEQEANGWLEKYPSQEPVVRVLEMGADGRPKGYDRLPPCIDPASVPLAGLPDAAAGDEGVARKWQEMQAADKEAQAAEEALQKRLLEPDPHKVRPATGDEWVERARREQAVLSACFEPPTTPGQP